MLKTLLLLLSLVSLGFSQIETTIMTYNVLDYSGGRTQEFDTIFDEIEPDVLVTQEISSQSGVNALLNVLNDNGTQYAAAPYFDGPDKDMGLFYRTSQFELLGVTRHSTNLRDIYQFRLRHQVTSDTLRIFSVHLKASNGTNEQQQRLGEVMVLRNITDNLPQSANFMVVGDFNIYYASEPAFQELIDTARGSGYVIDPINKMGEWHNNPAYSDIFTQSTRVNGGNGSGGGIDDRFDMMLVSANLLQPGGIDYVSGSYKAFGNDGQHFNQAINAGGNGVVDQAVANALHDASDHLPVLLKLRFEVTTAIKTDDNLPEQLQLYANYPNPFNPSTTIQFILPAPGEVSLNIFNARGQKIRQLVGGSHPAGLHQVRWDAKDQNGNGVASGIYFYQLQFSGQVITKKMLLIQ